MQGTGGPDGRIGKKIGTSATTDVPVTTATTDKITIYK